ncbi:ATPase domain-containing protein [Candidatus Altiarchaeota archaeon]
MNIVEISLGGKIREFPLGVSLLMYGPVGSGKTSFCVNLTKEFIANKLPCVWICLDESPNTVREKLEFFNIDCRLAEDNKLLKYIDVYSEQVTGKPLKDPAIVNCTSILNLNELNMSLRKTLDELKGQGLVIFDSLTTLLLYVNSSVCEEFLKVHTNRITSSQYTGIFILQENIHENRVEETFKMMMNGVLEFGLEEGKRRVGVDKLPLGSSSEWIGSSMPNMPDERDNIFSKPKPRKYLDSGGYLEGPPTQGWPKGVPGTGRGSQTRDSGYDRAQNEAAKGFSQEEARKREGQKAGIMRGMQPQIIQAQTIKLDGVNLKLEMQGNVKSLLEEQLSLRDEIHDHDKKIYQSTEKLLTVRRIGEDIRKERSELDGRQNALHKSIEDRKKKVEDNRKKISKAKEEYIESLDKSKKIEKAAKRITLKKKQLEEKLRNTTGETMILDIPSLQDEVMEAENLVRTKHDEWEALIKSNKSLDVEVNRIMSEAEEVTERLASIDREISELNNKESKIESEMEMIKNMRIETEKDLSNTAEKRRIAEEKLKKLMEEG